MNKKKMKVLKEALKEFKAKDDLNSQKNIKITQENDKLRKELKEKVIHNQELLE